MYKLIIFDFDGTIANTIDAGIPIFNDMARRRGFKELKDFNEVRNVNIKQFIKDHKISRIKFIFYLREFLKKLNPEIYKIKPYDGMENVIKRLNKDYKLGIVSANSKENIKAFLELNDLKYYFDFVYNYPLLLGKSQVFKKIIKEKKLDKKDLIYIGDEDTDVFAAKKTGIDVIAVTWGVKNKSFLKTKNPTFIADKPEEILFFLGKTK